MTSKGETTALKKSTTKRGAATKTKKKTSLASTPVQKTIRASIAPVAFSVPTPLPPPPPPAIALPTVVPPKAPTSWWVYVLIFLFSTSTLLIVGYVAIWRPFETPASPMDSSTGASLLDNTSPLASTPTTPTIPNVYSYASVVNVPKQLDFFTDTRNECQDSEEPVLPPEKPASVAGKLRVDLAISADIPVEATDETTFRTQLDRTGKLVDLFTKHKFTSTLFLTSPFINLADKSGATEIAAWAKAGNEVAVAFDPVAAFGVSDPAELREVPFGSWLLALHKQQVELEDLCLCTVTSWSGGGVYPRLYQAAKELGLTTHVDWSDEGATPSSLAVVNPWTPVQSGSAEQLETFDPFGSVVYLPNGVYPEQCINPSVISPPFSAEHFGYSTKAFYASLASTSADRVNVFRLKVNPNDFGDLLDDEVELDAWNAWLTTIVDPYVKAGTIVPSTDSASSAAFVAWLDQNIGKIELK